MKSDYGSDEDDEMTVVDLWGAPPPTDVVVRLKSTDQAKAAWRRVAIVWVGGLLRSAGHHGSATYLDALAQGDLTKIAWLHSAWRDGVDVDVSDPEASP